MESKEVNESGSECTRKVFEVRSWGQGLIIILRALTVDWGKEVTYSARINSKGDLADQATAPDLSHYPSQLDSAKLGFRGAPIHCNHPHDCLSRLTTWSIRWLPALQQNATPRIHTDTKPKSPANGARIFWTGPRSGNISSLGGEVVVSRARPWCWSGADWGSGKEHPRHVDHANLVKRLSPQKNPYPLPRYFGATSDEIPPLHALLSDSSCPVLPCRPQIRMQGAR